jgi:hypothetical protein
MFVQKRHYRVGQRRGLVAMRRMSARGQVHPGVWNQPRDGVDLRHRSVFVVISLHGQDRTSDLQKPILDVPGSEGGVEPDVVPAKERGIGVRVIARQTLAQVGRMVKGARGLDARMLTSSTKTCGATAMTPSTRSGKAAANSNAIDAPSL